MSGIYQIYNKTTNKRYIGSSINIERRWVQHKSALRNNSHHSKHLQNAWNKYGEESFEFICLEHCEPDELLFLEREYIEYYNTTNREFGYNTIQDVEQAMHTTAEDWEKISKANSGKIWTDERRQKFINTRTGKKMPKSSETKKRQALEGRLNIVRIGDVSEEKQMLWRKNISKGRKKYYETHQSVLTKPVKVELDGCTLYFQSVKQAAEYLNVCVDTIRNTAKRGKPSRRAKCRIYYISKEEYILNKNV